MAASLPKLPHSSTKSESMRSPLSKISTDNEGEMASVSDCLRDSTRSSTTMFQNNGVIHEVRDNCQKLDPTSPKVETENEITYIENWENRLHKITEIESATTTETSSKSRSKTSTKTSHRHDLALTESGSDSKTES